MIETAFFDIDGVLTDGMVYIDAQGNESKKISFDDIDAIFELKRAGVKVGFITGEDNSFSEYVKERFVPDYFISGSKDKLDAFKKLAEQNSIDPAKTCFAGDSTKDAALLRHIRHSFTPADVDAQVKQHAGHSTAAARGNGVIAEIAQFILKSRQGSTPDKSIIAMIQRSIREHSDVMGLLKKDNNLIAQIGTISLIMSGSLQKGGKVLFCGNGGSASDSQHLATELVSRFFMERKALDAEALTVNTSTLTAVGNDYTFADVFARQVEAKGKAGDLLFAISTSGNSANVVKAVKAAKDLGMTVIGMTGSSNESKIYKMSDHCICVPSDCTPRIQEAHILIGHIMCELIEIQLFQSKGE